MVLTVRRVEARQTTVTVGCYTSPLPTLCHCLTNLPCVDSLPQGVFRCAGGWGNPGVLCDVRHRGSAGERGGGGVTISV